jgi:hypothetical protein
LVVIADGLAGPAVEPIRLQIDALVGAYALAREAVRADAARADLVLGAGDPALSAVLEIVAEVDASVAADGLVGLAGDAAGDGPSDRTDLVDIALGAGAVLRGRGRRGAVARLCAPAHAGCALAKAQRAARAAVVVVVF